MEEVEKQLHMCTLLERHLDIWDPELEGSTGWALLVANFRDLRYTHVCSGGHVSVQKCVQKRHTSTTTESSCTCTAVQLYAPYKHNN